MPEGNALDTLFLLRDSKTRRISSGDPKGSNDDAAHIAAGETYTVAQIEGSGIIRHIWCTLSSKDEDILSRAVLRMYWDGEETPSVEVRSGISSASAWG